MVVAYPPSHPLFAEVVTALGDLERPGFVTRIRHLRQIKTPLGFRTEEMRERKIVAGGRGSGRFAYAQKVPQVVALVRELHEQRQSLRQMSKTLASQGCLTGGGRPYTATAVQKMLRAGKVVALARARTPR